MLILQSTVLEIAPVHMAAPSLGLLVVMHVGLSGKWSISSAALVAFATGYCSTWCRARRRRARVRVHAVWRWFAAGADDARGGQRRRAGRGDVLRRQPLSSFLVVLVRAQVAPEGGWGGASARRRSRRC
jgi:hypothetical protein